MTTTQHKQIGMDDLMPFGKYKGQLVWLVMKKDPGYLRWAIENTSLLLDNEAFDELQKKVKG